MIDLGNTTVWAIGLGSVFTIVGYFVLAFLVSGTIQHRHATRPRGQRRVMLAAMAGGAAFWILVTYGFIAVFRVGA